MTKTPIIHPQEIEAWFVLPAIRKELAMAMKQENLEQKKIAKLLGVTEAAVSHYIKNKRGCDLKIDSKLKKEFRKSARILVKDNTMIFAEIQRLLRMLWNKGAVCALHMEKTDVPKNCAECYK